MMLWFPFGRDQYVNLETVAFIQKGERIEGDAVYYQIRFQFSASFNDYVAKEWEDEDARNIAYDNIMRSLIRLNAWKPKVKDSLAVEDVT